MQKASFLEINKNQNDWWLSVKSKIIIEIINKYFNSKNISILDVSSGTGFISNQINNAGYNNITVSDKSPTALRILRKRFSKIAEINLPKVDSIKSKFDCILVLDVLEHINDDENSLKNIKKLLNKNGKIIITAPAFEFLWSKKDDRLEHKRRYTKKTLLRIINRSDLYLFYLSYYNFFLFFPAIFYSLMNKKNEKISRYKSLHNLLFKNIFYSEMFFIKKQFHFPFGVSLIAVVSNAKKNKK